MLLSTMILLHVFFFPFQGEDTPNLSANISGSFNSDYSVSSNSSNEIENSADSTQKQNSYSEVLTLEENMRKMKVLYMSFRKSWSPK